MGSPFLSKGLVSRHRRLERCESRGSTTSLPSTVLCTNPRLLLIKAVAFLEQNERKTKRRLKLVELLDSHTEASSCKNNSYIGSKGRSSPRFLNYFVVVVVE